MNAQCGFVRILVVAIWIMVFGHSSYAYSAETKILRVSGSDNVARFVSIYAKDYMMTHPDVSIVVLGGKTSTGLRGLLEGTAELAMASRSMTTREEQRFRQKGMRLQHTQVGWCSIVVLVHHGTPVNSLTKDQLIAIFKGDYINWIQVGGPDQAITVVAAEDPEDDATAFFNQTVMAGAPYTKAATVVTGIQTVLSKVLETEGSIGFCRVTDLELRAAKRGGDGHRAAHVDLPKVLAIALEPGAQPVLPPMHHHHSMESSMHGDSPYPIQYPLYLNYSEDSSMLGKEFVNYCADRGMNSPHGHKGPHGGAHVPTH